MHKYQPSYLRTGRQARSAMALTYSSDGTAAGLAPQRRPGSLQKFHANATRDVRRTANKSGPEYHQTEYNLQRCPQSWPEACSHPSTSCVWDQVSLNVLSIAHNTISLLIPDVCQAIIEEDKGEMMKCPTTPNEWRAISDQFMEKWNFPHTCGALDGKHVSCKCPNYKGFYSVVLMALVDADYRFIWVDIGGMGSASDAQIYNASELRECVEDGSLGLPDPDPLPNDNQDVPYFFVGDDAFALRPNMMKPYSLRGMTQSESIFNYRLSRARRVVENAFGILSNRYQNLLTTMQQQPATVKLIVTACIILHNLMRTRYPGMQNQQLDRAEDLGHDYVPGAWRSCLNMQDTISVAGSNTSSREGKRQRNLIKHWVNSEAGAVPWQEKMI
ncbi:uncharacterized protein LOC135155411 [Lytechinus pictus]|uniref:uncharacterized protein LOC135155411 n=1 Tax=Lytechinus pictus TaxID=7653 RepID=UPI0030BA262B